MNVRAQLQFPDIANPVIDLQSTKKQTLGEVSPNVGKVRSAIGNRADLLAEKHRKAKGNLAGRIGESPQGKKQARETTTDKVEIQLVKMQSELKKPCTGIPSQEKAVGQVVFEQTSSFEPVKAKKSDGPVGVLDEVPEPNLLDDQQNKENSVTWIKALLTVTGEIDDIVIKDIFEKHAALGPGEVTHYANTGHEFLITKEMIYISKEKIGEGTFSEVFACAALSIAEQPTIEQDLVVKRSKAKDRQTFFSPEKRTLDAVMQFGTEGIDPILRTFKIGGRGYCICRRYDQPLDKVEFETVADVVSVFLTVARGLSIIHESGHIHRDLKPENIGFKLPKEAGALPIALLSDWGFLMRATDKLHPTIGTVQFLCPDQFHAPGQIDDADRMQFNLFYQKKRKGIQTQAGDDYALGRTFEEVLKRVIRKWGGDEAEAILKQMRPQYQKHEDRSFTDAELIELGPKTEFRVLHDFDKSGKDYLTIFAPVSLVREKLTQACSKIPNLQENEMKALNELCQLACDLQEHDLSVRPTSHQAVARLLNTLGILVPDLSQLKSPLRDIAMRDQSEKKSKKSLSADFEFESPLNPQKPEHIL